MVPRHDGDYHINDEVIQACEETADDQLGQGADPVPSIGTEYLKVMTSHFIVLQNRIQSHVHTCIRHIYKVYKAADILNLFILMNAAEEIATFP